MSKTTADNLSDRQGDVSELSQIVEHITDAISCAESCETAADFDANLSDVITWAEALAKDARALRGGK